MLEFALLLFATHVAAFWAGGYFARKDQETAKPSDANPKR